MIPLNKKIIDRTKNAIIWATFLLIFSFGISLYVYYLERDIPESQLQNLGDLYWWWIGNITSIGSSIEPVSMQARLIASIVVLAGFVLLGLFIAEFSEIIRMFYARKEEGNIKIRYNKHIVIFGYTSLTAGVLKLLRRHFSHRLKIVLISNDTDVNPFPGEVDFIHDNPISRNTLGDSNVSAATAVIILADDRFRDPDSYSLVIATGVERANTGAVTIVELTDPKYRNYFKRAQVEAFITKEELLEDLLSRNPDSKLKRIIQKETYLDETLDDSTEVDLI